MKFSPGGNFSAVAHGGDLTVLAGSLIIDLLVIESAERGADTVSLSHLEVLSEVLITAPPVEVDHTKSLVSSDLMEVGVSQVVLVTVGRHTSVSVRTIMHLVVLTNAVSPVLNHLLLLVLDKHPQEEGLVKVEDKENPSESNTVLGVERNHLPVSVSSGVFKESGDVLEGSPSLSIVSRLLGGVNKLAEVTIGLLGQGSV